MRSVLACLALAALASADAVVLRDGRVVRGVVLEERPEVVVNRFRSRMEGALGTERFAPDLVERVERDLPRPAHRFQRTLDEAVNAEDCLALAAWCEEQDMDEQRLVALERALVFDPGCAEARRLLGREAPPRPDPATLERLRAWLDVGVEVAREEDWPALAALPGLPGNGLFLRRAWRSRRLPVGYLRDRPLSVRVDRLPGHPRYDLVVPADYDPLRPTPLVIGLHGGGAAGLEGRRVAGAGREAVTLYRGPCERRGWILACPSALEPGWAGPANDALLDALLEELGALFNVDETRIYLVGHSMGGAGAWAQGERRAETWAALAAASSFDVAGIERLAATATGFYVYHGALDDRVPAADVRARMEEIAGRELDFVYTELPDRGHDIPDEIIEEVFRFFEPRRRAAGPAGRARPEVRSRSSFLRPAGRDEARYLPSLEGIPDAPPRLATLLDGLRLGGGPAERAAERLAHTRDPKTDARVGALLRNPRSNSEVRLWAARVLAARKARSERQNLERVLLVERDEETQLALLEALGEIDDPVAGRPLLQFLEKRAAGLFVRRPSDPEPIYFADWEAVLPPLSRTAGLLGRYRPPGAAEALCELLTLALLPGRGVVHDRQRQDPLPAARALVAAACEALVRLDAPRASLPLLERLVAESARGPAASVTVAEEGVALTAGLARDREIAAHLAQARAELAR